MASEEQLRRAKLRAQKLVDKLERMSISSVFSELQSLETDLKGTPEGRRLTRTVNNLDQSLQAVDRALVNVYGPRSVLAAVLRGGGGTRR